MPAADGPDEWELPKLRASFGFEGVHDDFHFIPDDAGGDTEFFDVKFYPYNPVGLHSVFAAVSKKHVVVCRLTPTNDKETNPCEIIQVIRDDDAEALNCSCTWTKDAVTEAPYLCISGRDAKVKVYELCKGKLVTTLVGHGGEINDLATSPANPLIIASASDDNTVRIWSLDPVHAEQPCVCILGGEGHSWNLLSVAFHQTGRYVLSAGHDQTVNLWTLPDLPTEHVDHPIVNYYPHFSTSEIHTGLIDCVAFYGDMILSRACHEDTIVLWCVEGFSSKDPPPPPSEAPTNHDPGRLTRSAFVPVTSAACPAQYTRLLQFHTKGCGPQFFMRFSMLQREGMHPVLAFCNTGSRILFWDMARMTGYHEFARRAAAGDPSGDRDRSAPPLSRPGWLEPLRSRKKVVGGGGGAGGGGGGGGTGGAGDAVSKLRGAAGEAAAGGSDRELRRGESPTVAYGAVGRAASTPSVAGDGRDNKGGGAAAHGNSSNQNELSLETSDLWEGRYSMGDPQGFVKPHKMEVFGTTFVGRQVAWSVDGAWCVVVGSKNLAIILQRWHRDDSTPVGTPRESAA